MARWTISPSSPDPRPAKPPVAPPVHDSARFDRVVGKPSTGHPDPRDTHKAHSRTGITSFEIAELAKLRGVSPSAPLREIFREHTSSASHSEPCR